LEETNDECFEGSEELMDNGNWNWDMPPEEEQKSFERALRAVDTPVDELRREAEQATARLTGFVSGYDPCELLRSLAMLYAWNGSPPNYPKAQFSIQKVAEVATESARQRPDGQAVLRLMELLRRCHESEIVVNQLASFEGANSDDSSKAALTLMRLYSSTITNPGTTGEMVSFGLKKFGPHRNLLLREFGFDARWYFISILAALTLLGERVRPALEPDAPILKHRDPSSFVPYEFESPPQSFAPIWEDCADFANTRNLDFLPPMYGERTVRFLSADYGFFRANRQSFSRWAFLADPEGKCTLLISQMLVETALTALQIQILTNLPEKERSQYGNQIGENFEGIVADAFKKWWPDAMPQRRVNQDGDKGDTDVLVRLSNGRELHAQCKGKLLTPSGRWGRVDVFQSSVLANVVDAIGQAKRIIKSGPQQSSRPEAVLIVLEASFPGLLSNASRIPSVQSGLLELPHPIVLDIYDLWYLLRKVPEHELSGYLAWRDAFLASGQYSVADEFDVICAYLERHRLPLEPRTKPPSRPTYIGYDPELSKTTMLEALEDLRRGDSPGSGRV